MTVKLLTEHHLEFLSLKGGCTDMYESTLVKMPHFSKSHFVAHLYMYYVYHMHAVRTENIQDPEQLAFSEAR